MSSVTTFRYFCRFKLLFRGQSISVETPPPASQQKSTATCCSSHFVKGAPPQIDLNLKEMKQFPILHNKEPHVSSLLRWDSVPLGVWLPTFRNERAVFFDGLTRHYEGNKFLRKAGTIHSMTQGHTLSSITVRTSGLSRNFMIWRLYIKAEDTQRDKWAELSCSFLKYIVTMRAVWNWCRGPVQCVPQMLSINSSVRWLW